MNIDKHNNWDKDHSIKDENGKDIYNNNGKSSPVIISAECRIKRGMNDKLTPYDHIAGSYCSQPFRVTIHNYESEALGNDPTIKSEQNYYRFLHLSTLMNFPWGLSVRFRDDDGVIFGAGDIIRLLEERSEEVMKKWEEGQVEFRKRQDETMERLKEDIRSGNVNDNDIMEI